MAQRISRADHQRGGHGPLEDPRWESTADCHLWGQKGRAGQTLFSSHAVPHQSHRSMCKASDLHGPGTVTAL